MGYDTVNNNEFETREQSRVECIVGAKWSKVPNINGKTYRQYIDEKLRSANIQEVYTTALRVSVRVSIIVVKTIATRSFHSVSTLKNSINNGKKTWRSICNEAIPPPAEEEILESVKEDILDIKADKLNYLLMSRHQHAGHKKKTER